MKPLSLVIEKLDKVRPTEKGYIACCPAHEDRNPSLSISEGDDGRVLLHCHAGCEFDDIVVKLGLHPRDLMPAHDDFRSSPQRPSNAKPKVAFATAEEAIRAYGNLGQQAGRWDYYNADGELVGVVIRWNKADGSKTIRPLSRHGSTWRMEAMPSPRPLYRLGELKDAPMVLVVEGEKVADAARSLGFIATTSAGGSQAADKTDWLPLTGKEVWVLRDLDKPGEKYALDVARLATAAGARVKLLEASAVYGAKATEGYDLADAIAKCKNDDERVGLREQINMVGDDTELWQPPPPEPSTPPNRPKGENEYRQELDLVCMADVQPRQVEWLWPLRIPLGAISLSVGRPGVGKSFFTYDLAARVSNGDPWPDAGNAPKGDVLIVNAEDDIETIISPRLIAAKADMRRVHAVRAVNVIAPDGKKNVVAFDLGNVDMIRDVLRAKPNIRLIVVDPVGSFLGGKVDAYRDDEVRAFLNPLASLAQEHRLAVLLVCHTRKGEVAFADDATLGSRAFVGLARSVLHVSHDKNDRQRRLLLPGKSNWGVTPPGLAYRIAGDPACVEWEPEPLNDLHADDVLGNRLKQEGRRGPLPEALNTATDWLRNLLGDGPLDAFFIKEQAEEAGLSWGTVRRAKDALGIVPNKPSFSGGWVWCLPPEDAQDE